MVARADRTYSEVAGSSSILPWAVHLLFQQFDLSRNTFTIRVKQESERSSMLQRVDGSILFTQAGTIFILSKHVKNAHHVCFTSAGPAKKAKKVARLLSLVLFLLYERCCTSVTLLICTCHF